MNTPQRFEPVPPLFLAEGAVIHTSTRTSVATNMDPDIEKPAFVSIGSSRLDLVVGPRGALQVRYAVQAVARVPGRALGRRMVNSRR